MLREGSARLIAWQPGFRIAAEADDAASAYRAYREVTPDVVVMNLSLPAPRGLDAAQHIRQWNRNARILIIRSNPGSGRGGMRISAGWP